ncbi:MAG: endonuclease domain-containing protein [Bellilinea sp.]
MPPRRTTPKARFFARELRKNMTPTEYKLWGMLRSKQLQGIKFRRQHPIGIYIVDFCAPQQKLVIELDGNQHGEKIKADEIRTRYLNSRGYRVIRFWNYEVETNLDGVLMIILESLGLSEDTPSNLPLFDKHKKGEA